MKRGISVALLSILMVVVDICSFVFTGAISTTLVVIDGMLKND